MGHALFHFGAILQNETFAVLSVGGVVLFLPIIICQFTRYNNRLLFGIEIYNNLKIRITILM